MTWRKWLVRGLVFTALSGLVAVGAVYHSLTRPEAIRRLVLDKLGVRFVHVNVSVESASLTLLGGIAVNDLRFARSDRIERPHFLYCPHAVFYHDKEQLLTGKVGVRKIELDRAELRLVRERDGGFNLKGVLGPVDLRERLPTVIIRQGTIVVEDQSLSPNAPLLVIKDVHLTLLNDPLPTLVIEGHGRTDVAGPLKFKATVARATMAVRAHLELTAVPVGGDLVQRLAGACPELAGHLRQLTGTGGVEADLHYDPDADRPFHYEVKARLRDGTLAHARLPVPLRQVNAEARLVDGAVPEASLTALVGPCSEKSSAPASPPCAVKVKLKDLRVPAGESAQSCPLEKLVGELELKVERLPVTPEVLAKLPAELDWVEHDYAPRGPMTVTHLMRRASPSGPAVRRWVIAPEAGARAVCCYFPLPVEQLTGSLTVEMAGTKADRAVLLDLHGMAGGQPVSVTGRVLAPGHGCAVAVDVRGKGLPLDDRVFLALQAVGKDAADTAAQFLPDRSRKYGLRKCPMGRADFDVALRRQAGQKRMQNTFTIRFKGAAAKYVQFPYALENVSGTLVLAPDHWECKGFRGEHAGGTMFVDGRSHPLPPRPGLDHGRPGTARSHLTIKGDNIPLDDEFARALAPPDMPDRQPLFNAWRALGLAGRMSFAAEVIDYPGRAKDIAVGVEIQGCTLRPTFFDYPLEDVCGSVSYAQGKAYLNNLRARHGASALGITWGLLQIKPEGGFQAWLRGIEGKNLVPDEQLLNALPGSLRAALGALHLKGLVDVRTDLTLDAASGSGPLKVWWDGGADLRQASFRAGVKVTGAEGQMSCRGHHTGRAMAGLTGGLFLKEARALGQPVRNLSVRTELLPDAPNALRLYDLKAELFGGSLGGQARIDTGPVLRYDVLLELVGARLEQFGAHNLGAAAPKAQLEGPARAALHLWGEGADLLGLRGDGRIDVFNGKMGRLPLLLDLLKALGLRMPDRTAFVKAHVLFGIEGPQVRVDQLDLYGNAISLNGKGTVDVDGRLDLDFNALLGRPDLAPPGLYSLPRFFSKELLKIKMRGQVGAKGDKGVRFEKQIAPSVTGPLKGLMGSQ